MKYSGEASKQFYLGKFTKAGLSASYYGGERLDRFSRYQPSFLSRPRIRGIPSGTDTFDAIGVAGVQFGFNALDVVWVEGDVQPRLGPQPGGVVELPAASTASSWTSAPWAPGARSSRGP